MITTEGWVSRIGQPGRSWAEIGDGFAVRDPFGTRAGRGPKGLGNQARGLRERATRDTGGMLYEAEAALETPLPISAVLADLVGRLGAAGSAVLVSPPGTGKTTLVPLALAD